MTQLLTLGGRVSCAQCSAQSKRTKLQCRAPAIKGKTKCRFHGGRSTGARTAEGRARIAAVHTVGFYPDFTATSKKGGFNRLE